MADARPAATRWVLFGVLSIGIPIADQVAKSWILSNVPSGGAIEIAGPYLRLIVNRNTGGLFGLFQGNAPLFAVVSLAVMALIVAYEWRAGAGLVPTLALGLLLGGAIGNFIDRIRLGYVVDFVDMGIGGLRWYTYNVADTAISGAIVLLVLMAVAPGLAEWRGRTPAPSATPVAGDAASGPAQSVADDEARVR